MSDFITDCINGNALLSDVNDYIDSWHNTDIDVPLYQYLGMTKEEYSLFVIDEMNLADIIIAHKKIMQ